MPSGYHQDSRILSNIKIGYIKQAAIGTPETPDSMFNCEEAVFKFDPVDVEFAGTQGHQFKRKDAVKRVTQDPTLELTTYVYYNQLSEFLENLTSGTKVAGTGAEEGSSGAVTWADLASKTLLFKVDGGSEQTCTFGVDDDTQAEVIAAFNLIDANLQMEADGATMVKVVHQTVGENHYFEFTGGTGLGNILFDGALHYGTNLLYVWAKKYNTDRFTFAGWDGVRRYRIYDAVITKITFESGTGEALLAKVSVAGRTFDEIAEAMPATAIASWDYIAHVGSDVHYRLSTGSDESELDSWNISGEKVGANCDADGKIYLTVAANVISLYSDVARTAKVLEATATETGIIALAAQNSSGLSGTVNVNTFALSPDTATVVTLGIKLAVSKVSVEVGGPVTSYLANSAKPVDHIRHGWMKCSVVIEGLLGTETNLLLAEAMKATEAIFEEVKVLWLDGAGNGLRFRLRDIKLTVDQRKLGNDEEITPFAMTGELFSDGSAVDDEVIIEAIVA